MQQLAQVLINAVLLGGFYALMSQGLAISFGVLRLPNLAHGSLVVFGAYTNWWLSDRLGLDGIVTAPLAMLVGLPVGWLVCRVLFIPLLDKPHFVQFLVCLGFSLFIETSLILAFSADPARVQSSLADDIIRFGGLSMKATQVLMFATALILVSLLAALLRWSSFGKSMRAVADDLQAATVIGLPVNAIYARSFALGTLLTVAAGAVMGANQAFLPTTGLILTLKCFIIVVVGGHSRVSGTVIAAFLLAVIEVCAATYIPGIGTAIGTISSVVLLAIVLAIRPEGLMNQTIERAQAT